MLGVTSKAVIAAIQFDWVGDIVLCTPDEVLDALLQRENVSLYSPTSGV